jgi:hypothetical protein
LTRQRKSRYGAIIGVGKIIPLQVTGKDGGPIQYQGIDAPAKETREEWLVRQAKCEQPSLH